MTALFLSFNRQEVIDDIHDKMINMGWHEKKSFLLMASPNSTDMFVSVKWNGSTRHFFDATQGVTDHGSCSMIMPYLDFDENLEYTTDRPYPPEIRRMGHVKGFDFRRILRA